MTDSTIFNADGQTNQQQPATQQTTEQQTSLLTALVGEGQKYKTPEELAKAYANADTFIEQLKEENRKLREQAQAAKTIDEVLERISATQQAPQEEPPAVSGIKPEDVQQLVAKTLEEREAQAIRTQNLMKADAAMKAKFGEKAKEVFTSLANSPKLQSTFMEIAAVDPDKFVAMFAAAPVTSSTGVDNSSVSTSVMPNSGNRASVEGTKEWAAKIRKEQPAVYWSQEFQTKLQNTVTKNPQLYFGS